MAMLIPLQVGQFELRAQMWWVVYMVSPFRQKAQKTFGKRKISNVCFRPISKGRLLTMVALR